MSGSATAAAGRDSNLAQGHCRRASTWKTWGFNVVLLVLVEVIGKQHKKLGELMEIQRLYIGLGPTTIQTHTINSYSLKSAALLCHRILNIKIQVFYIFLDTSDVSLLLRNETVLPQKFPPTEWPRWRQGQIWYSIIIAFNVVAQDTF